MSVLEIRDLALSFKASKKKYYQVLDHISFSVEPGTVFGIVGESGCGKSVTALSIMRLLSRYDSRIDSGEILFQGEDILKMKPRALRKLRGSRISMIFQDPISSLNPVFTIGNQLVEVIMLHQNINRREARKVAANMLELVGIVDAEKNLKKFPHQLSGGMRQRVMIAIALACQPDLIIADEPTTALDVTIQAQVLDLMLQLQQRMGTAIILITHDLGVIAEMAHQVMVMYTGNIMEQAPTAELLQNPCHPYTQGLIKSIPGLDHTEKYLYNIPGTVPAAGHFPQGCCFHPRCPYCMDICRTQKPPAKTIGQDGSHIVYCWLDHKGGQS